MILASFSGFELHAELISPLRLSSFLHMTGVAGFFWRPYFLCFTDGF